MCPVLPGGALKPYHIVQSEHGGMHQRAQIGIVGVRPGWKHLHEQIKKDFEITY